MKKLIIRLTSLAFLLALAAAPAFAHTESDPFSVALVAGKATEVGDVLIWEDDVNLYVKYVVTDDWCLTETHLQVATSLDGIPKTRKGNPIPGRFSLKGSHDCVKELVYEIPLTWDPGTVLFVAAQAVVKNETTSKKESAWGAGTRFSDKRNWATYFTYNLEGPGLSLEKTCTDASAPGEPINFSAVITNTGTETLTGISCQDDTDAQLTGVPTSLKIGESATVTGSYVPTTTPSTDILTCTAIGAESEKTVEASDDATCQILASGPALSVEKTCTDASAPGESINFSAVITNRGTAKLINIVCSDDPVGTMSVVPTELGIGASATITGSYVPTTTPSTDILTCTAIGEESGKTVEARDDATCTIKSANAIEATVRIEPETLNLKSQGGFTAFIELPQGYKVSDIDMSTVQCEGAPATSGNVANNKLIAKFDRQALLGVLPGDEVTLTVTGTLSDGTTFSGSDTVRVIDKGKK